MEQTIEYRNVDPFTNPELANQIAASVMEEDDKPLPAPQITAPPDGVVNLPGGIVTGGQLVMTAEVRELNGLDEEEVAKPAIAADFNRFVDTLLNRCVTHIGDVVATQELLDSLLLGDREMLLQGIRVATFGDEMKLNLACPRCEEKFKATYSFASDVRIQQQDGMEVEVDGHDPIVLEAGQRVVEIPLKNGRTARVRLIDGRIQKLIYNKKNSALTAAALNTLLLNECIEFIDDEPMTMGEIRALGTADRMRILNALGNAQHGPRWDEAKEPCPSCEWVIPIAIDVNLMFRGA